jgi:macrolide transport system ATP-binding/permease protein
MFSSGELRARSRAQLVAADVSVERSGTTVLRDVSVSVTPGARLGVVGENGRGKSTLVHVLAGTLVPASGSVRRIGSLGIAEQEIAVDARRTVGDLVDLELADSRRALAALEAATAALARGDAGADAAYADALEAAEALGAWDADRRVDVALAALGAVTDRGRRLATMSVGERYRVRLACLLGAQHDFLLLDEPTNHLDHDGLEFLTDALRATASGVVLVSHDRLLLTEVADRVLDLDPSRDGRPRLYGDGYGGYLAGRAAEAARWAQAYEQHEVEQARLTQDLSTAQNRLQSGWRPPKGMGKHQRATRAPALVRAVNRRLADLATHAVDKPEPPLRFQLPDLPAQPGMALLRADEVRVADRLPGPVSLTVASGDRLLVTGPNGAGKSTLLAVLAGNLPPTHGHATAAPGARIGVLAQEPPTRDRRTAHEVFEARARHLRAAGLAGADIVPLRALGLLGAADLGKPVAELSIGQQRRLDLALALAGRPTSCSSTSPPTTCPSPSSTS